MRILRLLTFAGFIAQFTLPATAGAPAPVATGGATDAEELAVSRP